MTASGKAVAGVRTFAADVASGFLEVTHSGFALLGLAVAFAAIALTARPDLRQAGEEQLMGWLQARQVAVIGFPVEPGASERRSPWPCWWPRPTTSVPAPSSTRR
jgi:hypothetical protein